MVRRWHLYLGVVFAPSIIFFALTGALQTLGLHEHRPNSRYQPPTWIATLARIHKDQTLEQPRHKAPTPEPSFPSPMPIARRHSHPALLKAFVLVMAVSLIATTFLGLIMSFAYQRSRKLLWSLLALGAFLPTIFLFV